MYKVILRGAWWILTLVSASERSRTYMGVDTFAEAHNFFSDGSALPSMPTNTLMLMTYLI